MSKKDQKNALRNAIFEKGVQALRLITSSSDELYKCPICTKPFDWRALDDRVLTLEDVPPKAVGGKAIALTCKKCNNTAGHSVDVTVSDRQEFFQMMDAMVLAEGNFDGRALLNIGGESVNIDLKINDNNISLSVLRDKNDPKALSSILHYFKHLEEDKSGEGMKFQLTPQIRLRLRFSKISDLRAAYLAAFAAFGYSYALNNHLDVVRQQILNPEDEIISGFWSFLGRDAPKMRKLILTSEPFTALLVIIDKAAVVLPWIDGPDNMYNLLSLIQAKDGRINFQGIELEWPSRLQMVLDFKELNVQQIE